MARPKNNRIVHTPPLFSGFKPIGVKRGNLQTVNLSLDEYEAIRLADKLGLSHLQASEEMNISRSTFSRLIENARKKVSDFIISGKFLQIEGGNIHFQNNLIKCSNCNYLFKVSISVSVLTCPKCGSHELNSIAGEYGHGRCCTTDI